MPIQLASDNFTRANANPIGSPWLPVGVNHTNDQLQIVSNNAEANIADAVNLQGDYYSTVSWPNDQYSEVTVGTLSSSSNYIGPGVRWKNDNSITGYEFLIASGAGSSFLQKNISGTGTLLGTYAGTINPGDVVRLTVQGTTLTVSKNGTTIMTVSDSAISTGNAAVIAYHPGSTLNDTTVSLWAGGNLLTPGSPGRGGTVIILG